MAGNAVIGAARVSLGLDSASLEAGVKKARASIGSLSKFNIGRGLQTGLDEAAAGFRSTASQAGILGSALSSMGAAGVAVGAVIVSLGVAAAATRKAMEFGDEIADTANKLAVSTKTLQEYRYAVHALGGDFTDADKALGGFAKAFGAAQLKLSARATKPFDALGIDVQQFDTLEDALRATIDKVHDLSSTSEQAAISEKLGIGDMLPAIRAGTAALDHFRAAAERIGYVMSDEVLQGASEANDKMQALDTVIKVQLSTALLNLAPLILKVTEGFAAGTKALADYAKQVGDTFTEQKRQTAAFLTWLGSAKVPALDIPISGPVGTALKWIIDQAERKAGTAPGAAKAAPAVKPKGPAAGPKPDAPAGGGAGDNRAASASAIEAARRAELNAQMGLTHNIERLATMRLQQLDAETASTNAGLRTDAAEGRIADAAAATAIALNNQAATAQRTAILRDRDYDLARAALDQRAEAVAYSDDALRSEAALATTANERGRIEAAALENRQQLEADTLALETQRLLDLGEITKTGRDDKIVAQAQVHELERTVQAQQARYDVANELHDKAEAELALQKDGLLAQADLAQSDYARAVLNLRILAIEQREARNAQQRIIDTTAAGTVEHETAQVRLAMLDDIQAAQTQAAKNAARLDRALVGAAGDVAEAFNSFKSHDMEGAFGALSNSMFSFAGILGKTGSSLLGKLGTSLGTIGATAGIGQSLGINGSNSNTANLALAGGGYALGTAVLAPALYTAAFTSAAAGAGAGIVGSLGLLAGAAGPIGLLAALAVGGLVSGGKESNHGAIATLSGDSYSLSGDKRNEQTTNLASSAAQTILESVTALKAAGIELTTSVHAIDIGTRDAAHVILSNGQVLAAGVGDVAGAAEAALHAMLDGATYANEAQEKLVRSMLDAGTGFDKIAEALNLFGDQLKLPAAIADAIQQITDPKGFDLSTLKRAQAERRQQIDAAVAGGAIAADAAAGLYAQLTRLEGLEIDQVLARYADKIEETGDGLADLNKAVTDAEGDLRAAYNAQAAVLGDNIKRLRGVADSLRGFDERLGADALAARDPGAQTAATRAALAAMAGSLDVNDAAAVERLQAMGQAFVEASKTTSPTEAALQEDIAWVRRLIGQAAVTAEGQADLAQQQLDTLNDQVGALIKIDDSVLSVRDAINGLTSAQAARSVAASLGVANDNGSVGGVYDSATDSWSPSTVSKADLDRAHAAGIGVSGPAGDTARLLIDMYRNGGFDHLVDAQGNPTGVAAQLKLAGFKGGGQFRVGGTGPLDSQLTAFWASPGEMVSVTHGDPMGSIDEALSAGFKQLGFKLDAVVRHTFQVAKQQRRWDGSGMPPVRTVGPGGDEWG